MQDLDFSSYTIRALKHLLSEKALKLSIGVFLHIMMARHLGPELMGKYSYVTDMVAVMLPFIILGLDDFVARDLKAGIDRSKVILNITVTRLFFASLSYLLMILLIFLFEITLDLKIGFLVFGLILFFRALDTITVFLQSEYKVREVVMARQQAFGITSAFKLIGILSGAQLIFFLSNFAFQQFLEKALVVKNLAFLEVRFFKIDYGYIKQLLSSAFPIFLTILVLTLDNRIGIFFVQKYFGFTAAGSFGLTKSLLDILDFFAISLSAAVYPFLVDTYSDSAQFQRLMIRIYFIVVLTCLGVFIINFLVGGIAIPFVFGTQFDSVHHLIYWGIFSFFFIFMSSFRVRWYFLTKKSNIWFYMCLCALLISVILQFLWGREVGLKGPFLFSIIGNIMANIAFYIFMKETRPEIELVFKSILFPFFLGELGKNRRGQD